MTRYVRMGTELGPRYGVLEGDEVVEIDPHPFVDHGPSGRRFPVESVRLLAPVIPSKIVCIGKNYRDHAAEMGGEVPTEPLLFLKPSSSVIGPGDPILLPPQSQEVHHEAELAVVIGGLIHNADPETAATKIFGYTAANDVTARDLQRRDSQWTRAKGFDSFCPLGPAISTDLDPASGVKVRSWVDDDLRQDGTTADLVFDVPTLVSHISSIMSLLPGDVILTGTPAGVGPIHPGQRVRVEVEGVGVLANPVTRA